MTHKTPLITKADSNPGLLRLHEGSQSKDDIETKGDEEDELVKAGLKPKITLSDRVNAERRNQKALSFIKHHGKLTIPKGALSH